MNPHRLLLSIVIGLGILIILMIGALIYGFAKKNEKDSYVLLERSHKEIATLPADIDINLNPQEKLLHFTPHDNKIILHIGDENTQKIMVFSLNNGQKIAVFNLK